MTISTTASTVTYQGNGATTSFSFSFVPDNATDIQVYVTDTYGTVTLLTGTQYTLVFNPVPVGGLWSTGGYVTYPISGTPLAAGEYISIVRAVPYTQDVSISNQGAFYPQAVEQAIDILELQIQQLNTGLGYTIRCPIEDLVPPVVLPPASQRANGFLGFNSQGQPIIVDSTGGITPVPVGTATPRVVNTSGTNTVNVLSSDSLGGISIYQTGSPVTTVQLPTGYGPYPIFDGNNNAGTYPITILPPLTKTIQGRSSYILAFDGQSACFYWDGLQYLVL